MISFLDINKKDTATYRVTVMRDKQVCGPEQGELAQVSRQVDPQSILTKQTVW